MIFFFVRVDEKVQISKWLNHIGDINYIDSFMYGKIQS